MRTIGGILIGTVMLFVGLFSLSYQSQSVESTVNNSTSPNADPAFETSNQLFQGLFDGLGTSIVWIGVAAIILVSLGFLAYSLGGSR